MNNIYVLKPNKINLIEILLKKLNKMFFSSISSFFKSIKYLTRFEFPCLQAICKIVS